MTPSKKCSIPIEYSISKLDHDHVYKIVDGIWDEWSEDYIARTQYKTQQDLEALYFKAANNAWGIPEAYVILGDDGTLIGSCLIDVEDMGVQPTTYISGPWLANVYINKPFRNKGYATRLLEHVTCLYDTLHLWTCTNELATFYENI